MTEKDSIEMQHPCFVAVDLGASSGRVIAAQLRAGTLRLQEVSRFPSRSARINTRIFMLGY